MPENLIDLYNSPISRQFEILATALKETTPHYDFSGSCAFSAFIASEMVKTQQAIDPNFVYVSTKPDEYSPDSSDHLCHDLLRWRVFPLIWNRHADEWWGILEGTEHIMEDVSLCEEDGTLEEIIDTLRLFDRDIPQGLRDLQYGDEVHTIVELHDRVKDILLSEELDAICQDICEQIAEVEVGFSKTAERLLSDDEKKFLKELPELRYRNRAVVLTFAQKFASSK